MAVCLLAIASGTGFRAAGGEIVRTIPPTLPSHPGNIFLAGESVVVAAPPGEVETWRAVDYDGKLAAHGLLKDGKAEVGPLPVGWYKIVRGVGHITNRTFACVIEPLRAPTPLTSPVCIDVAMAWSYPKEKMGDVANLCQLAGINRVRDRLLWEVMEPKRGQFVEAPNQYDFSAQIQQGAGLQILQVGHVSASWANPNTKRFPPDLRDIYNFYREMARRWQGKVGAFEPWNEADIIEFGGHTGSEMASLQKAAYLGLKAGNSNVTACLNVFAIRRAATLSNFGANQAWPYFDTYNLHHYEPLSNYPSLYADHRAVSGGKPMWVSECSVHIKWRGDENLKELGDDDLRLQSERLTKTYVLAIHEGVQAVFYFMLPHYTERWLQYGLLRPDLTPRPGYVALAAVGRLLADAQPLGRINAKNDSIEGHLFRAKPDGQPADVLVIWADSDAAYELAAPPKACFDHLGRSLNITNNILHLGHAPIYAVLAEGARPSLIPPPKRAKLLTGKPGEVVLQAFLPEEDAVLQKSAYKIQPGATKTVPIFLYNFGPKAARGRMKTVVPKGWKVEFSTKTEILPGDRKEVGLMLTSPAGKEFSEAEVGIRGDFGKAGEPVLALRFIPPTN
jgi:hypothetical protein